jgi:hypothetical protein
LLAIGFGTFVALAGLTALALVVVHRPPSTSRLTATVATEALARHPWWDKPLAAERIEAILVAMVSLNENDRLYVASDGRWVMSRDLGKKRMGDDTPDFWKKTGDGYTGLRISADDLGYHKRMTREQAVAELGDKLDRAAYRDGRR